jgi:hypothetical protein
VEDAWRRRRRRRRRRVRLKWVFESCHVLIRKELERQIVIVPL